ncbi:2-keto-D-gluconate dehydrogenase [Tatumella ptyseos ATCC 33301]|uniref:2-keto-D-gluconate dehydrogenase n=3 Tax=Erwiniaceae TaxID=1903409 RepID=A0A085JDA0_9GAMM|nr:2-keto-D-gluconate dehydrogenase [Tatumella ptyseos ATCC 33301]SQK74334.1 Alcohol dehydrogenase cytochrome c subunit precursor [Tatumella ptyseos]
MKRSFSVKMSALALVYAGCHMMTASAADIDQSLLNQGQQVATASDCQACHTAPGSTTAFSGGYAIASPMGAIYSTNITPDVVTGIGHYTEAQFSNAVRHGIRADGAQLYPAMPYTSYRMMTDSDLHALYYYFMHGVKPVDQKNTVTALPFPFNIRFSMKIWNLLYADNKDYQVDPGKSAEWNRGNYLVNGLAHCDTCHTPRGFMMNEETGQALAGAPLGSWYAPNITSDKISGIGGWSDDEIVQYLKTGRAAGKNQAAGGMAEAVEHSLQYLPDSDLHAIATYLKQTTPIRTEGETQAAYSYGSTPVNVDDEVRGKAPDNARNSVISGAALFSGNCASCHQPDGAGSQNQAYPSLFHNTATGMIHPQNLIATILYGVQRTTGGHEVLMPGFGSTSSYVDHLTDQQVADISNYVLHNFGNPSVTVQAGDVAWVRKGGHPPALVSLQPYVMPAIAVVLVIFILLIIGLRLRRSRRH